MASGKGELDCCPDGKGQIANGTDNGVKDGNGQVFVFKWCYGEPAPYERTCVRTHVGPSATTFRCAEMHTLLL